MLLNTFLYQNAVGTSGVSYFFEERFEGTGYQNTWTENGANTGVCNEDYSTSPLEGTQGLLLSGTTQKASTGFTFPSDVAEFWGFFKLRIDTALTTNRVFFEWLNASATRVAGLTLSTTNTLTPISGTLAGSATVDAMSLATDYNIWIHFLKGSGANSVFSVGFSTGTTEVTGGNAFSSKTNGNCTTDAHDFTIDTQVNTTFAVVFDKLLMSTTATIGDNPA